MQTLLNSSGNMKLETAVQVLERLTCLGITQKEFIDFLYSPNEVQVGVANLFKHGEAMLDQGLCRRDTIDGDADPRVPEGWEVVQHQKCGKFRWNPKKVSFYASIAKPRERATYELRKDLIKDEVGDLPIFNANLFWYLYEHQWLIPADWNGFIFYFLGTVYRKPKGDGHHNPFVCGLQWFPFNGENKGNWRMFTHNMVHDFRSDDPIIARSR